MKKIIFICFALSIFYLSFISCEGFVITQPASVDSLKIDIATLKLEIDSINHDSAIVQLKSSISSINDGIITINTRIDKIILPDTFKQYIGNGNLIYKETSGRDTVNFMIDTVKFKIWKTGAEIN